MWDGAFSPSMRKSIGTVKFVSVTDMTQRDWDWLDYDNLRETAQNRIASQMVRGQLLGFFQVMITQKAKAKDEYFWPASAAQLEDFQAQRLLPEDFFRYEADTENIVAAVETVERLRAGVSFINRPLALLAIAAIVASFATKEYVKSELEKLNEELFANLGPTGIELLMSSIMLWELEIDEAERLLDEAPESDETDVYRDWVNDQVAAIQASRRRLAAGRGLTGSPRMV